MIYPGNTVKHLLCASSVGDIPSGGGQPGAPKGWAVSCLYVWVTEMGELWVGMADPASGDSRFVLQWRDGVTQRADGISCSVSQSRDPGARPQRVPPPPGPARLLRLPSAKLTPARASGCPSGFSSLSKNISLHPIKAPTAPGLEMKGEPGKAARSWQRQESDRASETDRFPGAPSHPLFQGGRGPDGQSSPQDLVQGAGSSRKSLCGPRPIPGC